MDPVCSDSGQSDRILESCCFKGKIEKEIVMRLSDFDYSLPETLIAYEPPEDRTLAKLLYVSKETKVFTHHIFREIGDFFKSGDVLVLNNTKVVPARLLGKRKSGGKVEALLLKSQGMGIWEALVRPSGRVKKGEVLEFGDNGIRLQAAVSDSQGQNRR